MSGNIDEINNINGNNGNAFSPLGAEAGADPDSIDQARNEIANLQNNLAGDGETIYQGNYSVTRRANHRRYSYADIKPGFDTTGSGRGEGGETTFVGDYTARANNRRYSYGDIKPGFDTSGSGRGQGGDTIYTGAYTSRANNRRYSYGDIKPGFDTSGSGRGQGGDTTYVGNYSTRANNRRYSYANIKPGFDTQGRDKYEPLANVTSDALRFSAGLKKEMARSRRMTAKDFLFQQEDRGLYSYGSHAGGGGQLMSRDEALDSLFYSDVANAMMDNGFALSRRQQSDIKDFAHTFSDEFASFDNVRSDLLYKQAAIVDALISNGGTLTPEQEIDLGIEDGLTNS